MKKLAAIILFLTLSISTSWSKTMKMSRKVENVTIKDLKGDPTTLPMLGEKHLLIFYVDPDHPSQNNDFTYWLEDNDPFGELDLLGFGVMNLKDAPFVPNVIARKLAARRTAKNKELVLSDEGRIISEAWGLGNCNNLFTILVVTRDCELVYMTQGELTEQEQREFVDFVLNLD